MFNKSGEKNEGNFQEFISIMKSFYEVGYSDKQIAELINIAPSHLSMIKNKQRNVSDKILSRMMHNIEEIRPTPMFKISNEENFKFEDIDLDGGVEDIGKLNAIFERYSKMYEDQIKEIRTRHDEEVNRLNSIIDNLRFIIERYEKDQGK